MESLAFALPLQPGQTEAWRTWSQELLSSRNREYRASRERLGLTAERAYLQRTPMGDFTVVYLEGPDLARSLQGIATSQEPFDRSFREKGKEFWGIDLAQPLPGPLSEHLFDGIPA